MTPSEKLIVALDVDSLYKAEKLVMKLSPYVKIFKIGSELFTSVGPDAISMVHNLGCKVFLDLKFHDIPNTVASAAKKAVEHKVFMFNVHAIGGSEMMKEAASIVKSHSKKSNISKPIVLGVTILTSMDKDEMKNLKFKGTIKNNVLNLAKLAKSSGLDGVVASPKELVYLRKALGKNFIIVTPGVRPAFAEKFDQKRIATPAEAIASGASFIVVGRPITMAKDPKKAALMILKEINEAINYRARS